MRLVVNSLAVNDFGAKENTPIIFVHGFPYDHTMWLNQINEFSEEYRCIAYDIRGLGDSYVGDGQYTMEAFVYDLYSIIYQMRLNKPILCGLSMGGYIALRAVEKEPGLFRGLILCDTKADADDDAGKLKRAAAIDKINVEGLGAFIDEFVPNCFSDISIDEMPELYASVLEKSKRHNPTGVKGALFAMLSRTDTNSSLSKIDIPTLVLAGSLDKLTPPAKMKEMADQIKDSEFGIAPRAGHMSPLENPDFVNDMIKGFLKRRIG
ncbi:MAG: alpha/beta hydrolase [bacterium]